MLIKNWIVNGTGEDVSGGYYWFVLAYADYLEFPVVVSLVNQPLNEVFKLFFENPFYSS